jgi:hypothetical protein
MCHSGLNYRGLALHSERLKKLKGRKNEVRGDNSPEANKLENSGLEDVKRV